MKKILLLVVTLGMMFAQTETDAIKKTAFNYAEGYYNGDGARMAEALHPDLDKRGLMPIAPNGAPVLVQMNTETLIEVSKAGRGKLPADQQQLQFELLDQFENIAFARIFTAHFNDYLHLVKKDGKWMIVNVLWTPPAADPSFKEDQEKTSISALVNDFLDCTVSKNKEKIKEILNPLFINKSMNPSSEQGKFFIQQSNSESLIEAVSAGMVRFPGDVKTAKITVLGVYNGIGAVKFELSGFTNYIQVAKQNGKWRMVNGLAYYRR